jgi:hypothetical protein
MGRPINKRFFGALADGTNFTVNCQIGANAETDQGVILSQRSVNKFNCDDDKTLGGNTGVCTLVDKAAGALGANEMSIQGTIAGGGDQVRIAKLYNRTCRDFSNNRYTWEIQDDSTASIMVITAI